MFGLPTHTAYHLWRTERHSGSLSVLEGEASLIGPRLDGPSAHRHYLPVTERARPAFDPRQIVAIIAALTALVTAITSLVKAHDKSVEQTGYEALSKSIKELQADNEKLHEAVVHLTAPSSSVDPGPVPSSPSSVAVAAPSMKPHAKPSFHLPPRPPLAAPPSWGDVTQQASKK